MDKNNDELNRALETYLANIGSPDQSVLQDFFQYLVECEGQALALIEYVKHPNDPPPKVPVKGSIEFGFMLYWIHYPPEEVKDWLIVKILQYEAPPTKITTAEYDEVVRKVETTGVTWDDGTLFGTQKYEQLDTGWAWAAFNYAINLIDKSSVVPFPNNTAYQGTLSSKYSTHSDPVIGIIGDWGTGYYTEENGAQCPAQRVLTDITSHELDYLMHLGDVYYAGTDLRLPPGEEEQNFLRLWPDQGAGRNFTLNSNHEMYGDGSGYFHQALASQGPFGHQNGMSYFSLTYGPWLLLGLDTAYYSDQKNGDKFYMDGAIGTDAKQQQIDWLKSFRGHQGPVMVISHHNPTDLTGGTNELFNQITDTLRMPAVWYWGHVHNGIVYYQLHMGDSIPYIPTKGRCCGHAAIPFGNAWELKNSSNIAYYAHTHDDQFPSSSPRVKNGYALITLHKSGGFTEAFYEVDNPSPVYQKSWQTNEVHCEE